MSRRFELMDDDEPFADVEEARDYIRWLAGMYVQEGALNSTYPPTKEE